MKNMIAQLFENSLGMEDISLREENIKHYYLGENRYQAIVYPIPVHQMSADGKWVDIDNTLELDSTAHGHEVYRNKYNRFRVEIPRRINNDSLVTIKDADHSFTWRFDHNCDTDKIVSTRTGNELRNERSIRTAQQKKTLTADSATAQERRTDLPFLNAEAFFDSILPGISVRYTLHGENLKEDIILADANAINYVALRLPIEYRYDLDENNEILIRDTVTGDSVFRMTRPIVYDANGKSIIAKPVLTYCEKYVRLSYEIDAYYLASASYPVTIDPVITTTRDKSIISDTYIWENNPDTNYSGIYLMRCGHGTGGESISLIQLNKLVKQRASDTIINAQLRLSPEAYPSEDEHFACYQIKQTWDQKTATWNSMKPNTTDYISDQVLSYIDTTQYLYNYFDITSLYRSWYKKDSNGKSTNHGVAIRYPKGLDETNKYVEWTATTGVSDRCPHFIINYVSHAGRAPWWKYESMSADRAGSAYVDLFNGNLVYEHSDSTTSGSRMPVSVSHIYNSCLSATDEVGCGMGWRTSMHHSMHKESLNDVSYYVWTDGNATAHYFKIEGEQPYEDCEGMKLKLNTTSTTITITDKEHVVMTFPITSSTSKTWLSKIADSCGNTMVLRYTVDGKISEIEDGVGRNTVYTYDNNGMLVSITAPGCPGVSYTYTDNHLTGIIYADVFNGNTAFSYKAGTGLLTTATNFSGLGLAITYEEASSFDSAAIDNYAVQACRVLTLEQTASEHDAYSQYPIGAKHIFEYMFLTAKVTAVESAKTDSGKTITYQFNDAGNVVSMYDELGFAQFNAFSETIPNQQTDASKLQRAVINLLNNIDFTSNWVAVNINSANSISSDSNTRCLNMPSYKIQCLSENTAYGTQTVPVEGGKSYTFSCFVKATDSCCAYLQAICDEKEFNSRTITASTATLNSGTNTNGWDRIFVTVDVPSSESTTTIELRVVNATGTAWFGAPQLETGHIPNRVNLLYNGDFTHTYTNGEQIFAENWSPAAGISSISSNGVISHDEALMPAFLSGNAMRIHSYCNTQHCAHRQIISVAGNKGDVYVFGGWIHSTSVSSGSEHFKPCIITCFKKADETWTDWVYHEYNPEQVGWKFGTWAVAAPEDYIAFRIGIQYARNSGTCCFANMFVHREQFGVSFAYDADNNLLSTTTLSDEKSSMEYDDFDNLISYIQPGADGSNKYLFTYGSTDAAKKNHLIQTETTPMGVKQHYTYDIYGNRLTSKTQKESSAYFIQSNVEYDTGDVVDSHGNIQKSVYKGGNYAVSNFDARGNKVSKIIDSESGLIYSTTDSQGQKVEYKYDDSNRVISTSAETDQGIYQNAYTYVDDRIATVRHNTTDAECDVAYTFEYDALGRKTSVSVGNQVLSKRVYTNYRSGPLAEVRYGNDGVVYESEDGQTKVIGKIAYAYDDFDRVISVTYDDETTPRFEYEYGANGQASFLKDNHLGRITQTEYDLSERPCQATIRDVETDALIYRTSLEYDKMNRLTAFREQTEHSSHETSFSYDKDNRTTAIQYNDADHKVEYTYDDLGRISNRKVTNGESEYNTSYDFVEGDTEKYGTGATTPLVKKITQPSMNFDYEYDERDNIISETRNGQVIRYEYDPIGQLIYVSDPHDAEYDSNGAVWFYDYDFGGNILEKRKYTRNEDGTAGALVESTSFAYGNTNWKDQLTSYAIRKYKDGTVFEETVCPIANDRIGNPLDDGIRKYEWEAGKQLKKITMKDDPANGIVDGHDVNTDTTLKISFSNGNLLADGVSSSIATASVMRNGEDVTANYPASEFCWHRHTGDAEADAAWDAAHAGVKQVTFTAADLDGNTKFTCNLTHTAPTFGSVQVDDSLNASHTRSEADANDTLILENGMLSVATEENEYELQNGHLIASSDILNGTVTAMGWVYTSIPDKVVEFKYNSAGLRVQKDVTANGVTETTQYILNGKLVTEMICGTDTLHFFYDAQSRPTKVNFNGTIYTYIHNLQGDIVGIIDSNGTLVVEYKYDAWGKPLATIGTYATTLGKLNPFRYRGYIYDEETGLYYLRSRVYSPALGRFLNGDTIITDNILGKNAFCYCWNCSENYLDSSGAFALTAIAFGSAVGFFGSILGDLISGSEIDVKGALVEGGLGALEVALFGGIKNPLISLATSLLTTTVRHVWERRNEDDKIDEAMLTWELMSTATLVFLSDSFGDPETISERAMKGTWDTIINGADKAVSNELNKEPEQGMPYYVIELNHTTGKHEEKVIYLY